ncbi:MAG: Uma2 family endonuclease [bacterium]|nr:Uma2 family endonuclease [bacterium]
MAAPETLKKPVTRGWVVRMGDIGRCELVEGEIIHMSPAGGRHGELANRMATLLSNYVWSKKLGKVYAAETGFYVRRNPDTVRAPDAMFVSNERVAQIGNPVKYLEVSPDLAVEVLSRIRGPQLR